MNLCTKCNLVPRETHGKCKPCYREYHQEYRKTYQIKPSTKPCAKCGSIEKNKLNRCVPCYRQYHNEYYDANLKKPIEDRPVNRICERCNTVYIHGKGCPECAKRHHQEYYSKNREKFIAKAAEYHKNNPDKVKIYSANSYKKLSKIPEKLAEQRQMTKNWRAKNREAVSEYNKYWRKNNPEKTLVIAHRRRARELNADGSFTEQEWIQVCENQAWECFDCQQVLKLTIGHAVPLSKGGSN